MNGIIHKHMRVVGNTFDVRNVDDVMRAWIVRVEANQCPTTLQGVMRKARASRIEFGITFPDDFPFAPPFVRVIAPEFVPQTGHVLQGGGLCTKMLSDGEWRPTTQVSSLIASILHLIDEGKPQIQKLHSDAYTESVARESYRRSKARYGW